MGRVRYLLHHPRDRFSVAGPCLGPVYLRSNAPTQFGALLLFACQSQQIVGGNLKKLTKGDDVIHTWLVFSALNVGNLPLRHVDRLAQLGLIQVRVLPQIPNFFAKG